MKWIAGIVMVSFVCIAIFGAFLFMHDSHHMMSSQKPNCIASVIDSMTCPDSYDMLGLAEHHISAYENLFTTLTSSGVLVSIVLLLVVIAYALFVQKFGIEIFDPILDLHSSLWSPLKLVSHQHKEFMRWLSLFELSPSYI